MLKDRPIIAYVPVKDMARGRRFYEEKVGLRAKEETEGALVFECGAGTRFVMYQSGFAGTNQASQAFWEVDDVQAEVAALRAKGVVFEEYDLPEVKTRNGIAEGGGTKVAWFKDPDGNIMALVQNVRG